MPITFRARAYSHERAVQTALDWVRRIMQISAVATAGLYLYLLYGLFGGDIGQWARLAPAGREHILSNVLGAILGLDVSLGLLLITLAILYYDEESLGYTLVAAAVFLYYGVPFLLDQFFHEQLGTWSSNAAATAILGQFRLAALMMATPGGILLIRDIILRFTDSSRRNKEAFSAMEYGGAVSEQPVREAMIGVLAKCWQLPYCRDAIRKRCPIFHAKTKCWHERVGCMCEENVIRHAMDAIINITRDDMPRDDLAPKEDGLLQSAETKVGGVIPGLDIAGTEKTEELGSAPAGPVSPKRVRIPHNPNLSMAVKKERCRNCVIYNEHQRLKYQFLAPLLVLAVPLLAFFKLDVIAGTLSSVLQVIDKMMARLSLDPSARNSGVISSITSSSIVAQYVVIGCLVVIVTTMALRFLEYCVFKLKI